MRQIVAIAAILLGAGPAWAGPKELAAKELAQLFVKKGSKEVIEHGAEAFARRIESMAVRHGDEVFHALKAVGPKGLPLIEKAGANGGKAAKVLARHGEKGAVWIVERPQAMNLVAKHGESAAAALVKHPGIAEPLIEKAGAPAVSALSAVGPRSARRLAMMAEGEAAQVATHPKVLDVIARWGEPAAEFVWKHKGALAVGTVLTAFFMEPEKFIDGTKHLTEIVATNAVRPLAETPGKVLTSIAEKTTPEIARNTNWSAVIPFGIGTLTALTGWFIWLNRRPRAAKGGNAS
jgi:hypothetical protein